MDLIKQRVVPNLPGFIQTINPSIKVESGIFIFDFAWLLGFTLSFILYVSINLLWPASETFVPNAILPDDILVERVVNFGESGNSKDWE